MPYLLYVVRLVLLFLYSCTWSFVLVYLGCCFGVLLMVEDWTFYPSSLCLRLFLICLFSFVLFWLSSLFWLFSSWLQYGRLGSLCLLLLHQSVLTWSSTEKGLFLSLCCIGVLLWLDPLFHEVVLVREAIFVVVCCLCQFGFLLFRLVFLFFFSRLSFHRV